MKNDTALFLLQEHNSIDQISPVIEMLANTGMTIILIGTVHDYDYSSDINLARLLNKFDSIHFFDLFLNKRSGYRLIKVAWLAWKSFLEKKTPLAGWSYRILCMFPRAVMELYLFFLSNRETAARIAFNSVQEIARIKLVVTEFSSGNSFYTALIEEAHRLTLPSVSFTHGFQVLTNDLLCVNDLLYQRLPDKQINPSAQFADVVVAFDSVAKKHFKSYINRDDGNVVQLPSLRYSSTWITGKLDELPVFVPAQDTGGLVKVVLMLSALNYNIWTDEQLRTAESILMRNDCLLAIKTHPRSTQQVNDFKRLKRTYGNLQLIGHEVTSSALIEWADLVISIGSGIAVEAIIRRKPLLYAAYLHANATVFDECGGFVLQANCRDAVHRGIDRVKDNTDFSIYEKQRREFLADYIADDDYAANMQTYNAFFARFLH